MIRIPPVFIIYAAACIIHIVAPHEHELFITFLPDKEAQTDGREGNAQELKWPCRLSNSPRAPFYVE